MVRGLTCSVIDRLLQKLVNEVTVSSVNLDAVKACLEGVPGPHSVQFHQPWNLRGINCPGRGQIFKGALAFAIWAEDCVVLARNWLVGR